MLALNEKTGNPRIVTSPCRQGGKISLHDNDAGGQAGRRARLRKL